MCWHKWSKWEQYICKGLATQRWGKLAGQWYNYQEKRQKRHCKKCGKQQDEMVLGS